MKKILILFSILFCTNILAQNNYYSSTKTFKEEGYTFQCDVTPYRLVTLYNKAGKFTYEKQVYKATGKPFFMPENKFIALTQRDNWTRSKRYSIVYESFNEEQKARVKGQEIIITMVINTNTGKVDEVYFQFGSFGPYATIPVSVYRKIESELKKNIWFTPTDEGCKLNYILRWWPQDPSEPI